MQPQFLLHVTPPSAVCEIQHGPCWLFCNILLSGNDTQAIVLSLCADMWNSTENSPLWGLSNFRESVFAEKQEEFTHKITSRLHLTSQIVAGIFKWISRLVSLGLVIFSVQMVSLQGSSAPHTPLTLAPRSFACSTQYEHLIHGCSLARKRLWFQIAYFSPRWWHCCRNGFSNLTSGLSVTSHLKWHDSRDASNKSER